ncbi:MAG: MipA/OmpV family protein [Mesorhizobium sp.]
MRHPSGAAIAATILIGVSQPAAAEGMFDGLRGDWYLTVGAAAISAPAFEGARSNRLRLSPMISLGKAGPQARFVSRNDNISLSLYDNGALRAGIAGKLIWGRDSNDHAVLNGVHSIPFGGEAGVFAEVYPTDWLRVRGEARYGIRSHSGVVVDVAADAFHDVTDTVRISAGPRLSAASEGYFDAYYGVNNAESLASGLTRFTPSSGGLKSVGAGGAITWKTTDQFTTSLFGEYARLQGPAARSSIVRERGSRDQLTLGVSATYRFDFSF